MQYVHQLISTTSEMHGKPTTIPSSLQGVFFRAGGPMIWGERLAVSSEPWAIFAGL